VNIPAKPSSSSDPAVILSPLYVVLDREVASRAGWTLADLASAVMAGGARLLQVRAKDASGAELLALAQDVVERARPAGAVVIVNDRADVARLAGAAGVHVGQEDLAPAAVRMLVGPQAIVGRSTHTPDQVTAALDEPISYLAIGPVFDTATKATGYAALGLERVAEVARIARARGLPAVAIGGITLDRAAEVRRAGAAAVAVITDLLTTGDPERRTAEYLRVLG